MRLMIDLETLGTKTNSVILSIGAVAFDENGIHDEFYCNVDLEGSLKHGFDIDADTLYWWLKQDKSAGEILSSNRESIVAAMFDINLFIANNYVDEVWANSPSFDLVMLKNAMEKVNKNPAWDFWVERDFRTFLSLTGAKRVYPDVAHNALEDARAQAQTLINYWASR